MSVGLSALALAALFSLLLPATPAGAQGVTERTPNLSAGWVGEPGALHFNFNHRFWLSPGNKILNSPSFLLGLPLPGRTLLAVQYASNSFVTEGEFNEWEFLGRWAFLTGSSSAPGQDSRGNVGAPEAAVTAAYNPTAGSADAELSVAVPIGGFRLIGSGRLFSDMLGTGNTGWFAGGGVVIPLRDNLTLAGDAGTAWLDGERLETPVWGAALQLQIPTTPHTFSIQAANTRTATLQGSAVASRTVWGFEFTIPFTFARYFGARRPPAAAEAGAPAGREGDVVIVTMNDQMRFVPGTVRIRAGQTIVWRNEGQLPHTVTADPDVVRDPAQITLPEGAEPFDSGNLFAGEEFRHTFDVPGEYVYICVPHDLAGMIGRVIVEG